MGFYRTSGAVAALLAMNILVWVIGVPIENNYVFGNHITESIMIIGLLGLLLDFGILNLNNGEGKKYLKIGIIAFLFGAVFQILSFASLMYGVRTSHVLGEWFKIAPFTIFLIGIPILYISDKLSYKRKILGNSLVGYRGIITNMVFCFSYSFVVAFLLFKYGYLAI